MGRREERPEEKMRGRREIGKHVLQSCIKLERWNKRRTCHQKLECGSGRGCEKGKRWPEKTGKTLGQCDQLQGGKKEPSLKGAGLLLPPAPWTHDLPSCSSASWGLVSLAA